MLLKNKPTRGQSLASLLGILLVMIWAASATADIVERNTYAVEGTTLEEVWESIEENGFTDEEGNVHAGKAEVAVVYQVDRQIKYEEIQMPECAAPYPGWGWKCTITWNVTYSIETKITLPEWPGVEGCGEVNEEWERFLDALREHEEGHDQVSKDALNNAQPKAQFSASGTGCTQQAALTAAQQAELGNPPPSLQDQLNAELDRLQKAVDDANENYDDQSDHGAADPPQGSGARLDTEITCEEEPQTPSEELDDLIWELGFLDHQGLCNRLTKLLENAKKEIDKGNTDKAKKELDKFIKAVEKERGKKLTEEIADYLIGSANNIKGML